MKKIFLFFIFLFITSCSMDLMDKPVKEDNHQLIKNMINSSDTLTKYQKKYLCDKIPINSDTILRKHINILLNKYDSLKNENYIFFDGIVHSGGSIRFNKKGAYIGIGFDVEKEYIKKIFEHSKTKKLKSVELYILLEHYRFKKVVIMDSLINIPNDNSKIKVYESYNKKTKTVYNYFNRLILSFYKKDDFVDKIYDIHWSLKKPNPDNDEYILKYNNNNNIPIEYISNFYYYINKITFSDTIIRPDMTFYDKYMKKRKYIKNRGYTFQY